jgi:hypothetical protein
MMILMPTTLTGLLLFVVLLLPGFAYAIGKEQHSVAHRPTPFRETAAVVAASVIFNISVLVIFAIVRALWPAITPDVGALVRDPGIYLRGGHGRIAHYGLVSIWAIGLLALASLFAYTATLPSIRRTVGGVLGPYPGDSDASGWWILFEKWEQKRKIHIGCILDDGSFVEGTLGSFSKESDDSPERDLILVQPISYRPTGAATPELYKCSAACVSASCIMVLFVTYADEGEATSPSAEEGAEEEAPGPTLVLAPSASAPS